MPCLCNIVYNSFIRTLILAMRIGACLGFEKLRKGLAGRQNQQLLIDAVLSKRNSRLLWLHAASLGEYEQARNLLDSIHRAYPDYAVLITFFSPSGLEHVQAPTYVKYLGYLPFDLPQLIEDFVQRLRPDLVIFVKYELWWNCLRICKNQQIPTILIAALEHSRRLNKFYSYFQRQALLQFEYIFTQDAKTRDILATFYPRNQLFIVGDPRVDRIQQLGQTKVADLAWMRDFKQEKPIFIAGSLERSDFQVLARASQVLRRHYKSILVPHEVDAASLRALRRVAPAGTCLLSEIGQLSPAQLAEQTCIIVDSIGLLNTLYAYTQICYVGGAWRKRRLHNILEPVGRGNLVITGPRIEAFKEAQDLHARGYIQVLRQPQELAAVLQKFQQNPQQYLELAAQARAYLHAIPASSPQILQILTQKQLLRKC